MDFFLDAGILEQVNALLGVHIFAQVELEIKLPGTRSLHSFLYKDMQFLFLMGQDFWDKLQQQKTDQVNVVNQQKTVQVKVLQVQYN